MTMKGETMQRRKENKPKKILDFNEICIDALT
jgi:hypothetical protein